MKISREWGMPNKCTFSIKPISEFLDKYLNILPQNSLIVDPFARDSKRGTITNDIDHTTSAKYHLDANEFMQKLKPESADALLFDPPYSGRQVKELYTKLSIPIHMNDTNAGYYGKLKNSIARIIKPKGLVITFGWNTNGIGKNRGFTITEILIVSHGSAHNDTLVTVELKEKEENKTIEKHLEHWDNPIMCAKPGNCPVIYAKIMHEIENEQKIIKEIA